MDKKASLFIEYKPLLFSMAYNMLGSVDTAEDIVQDTFLKCEWYCSGPEAQRKAQ